MDISNTIQCIMTPKTSDIIVLATNYLSPKKNYIKVSTVEHVLHYENTEISTHL